jgi:hypothetical protein
MFPISERRTCQCSAEQRITTDIVALVTTIVATATGASMPCWHLPRITCPIGFPRRLELEMRTEAFEVTLRWPDAAIAGLR